MIFYTKKEISTYIQKRKGEKKYGEAVHTVSSFEALATASAKYVLFGIPEDIGVRANHGTPGTANAWKTCLKVLLNMQANAYTKPENVVVLGEIECSSQMQAASTLDKEDETYYEELGDLVNQVDIKVANTVEAIIKAGKIPVIIGGGHNNSYGNIKGASFGIGKPLNVINFDAHSDFRTLEHRHSGNGFSYAFEQGFLNRYYIFGLHKPYTSQEVFERLDEKKEAISYDFFETVAIKKNKTFGQAMKEGELFVSSGKFGVELDMDAIRDVSSSARTPSGFSAEEARRFVSYFANNKNVVYLHLCEASPVMGTEDEKQTGKLLSYLVTDFTV